MIFCFVRAFGRVAVLLVRLCLSDCADGEIATSKTTFSVKFNSFIWICTTGMQFVVGWWYRKAAVFYLPHGWFGPLTWWLAFPFAPKGEIFFFPLMFMMTRIFVGSVSVGVWQMACRRVVGVCERVVKDFIGKCAIFFGVILFF